MPRPASWTDASVYAIVTADGHALDVVRCVALADPLHGGMEDRHEADCDRVAASLRYRRYAQWKPATRR